MSIIQNISNAIFKNIGISFTYDNNLRDDSYFQKRRYSSIGNQYLQNTNFIPLKMLNAKTTYQKDIFNLSIQSDFKRQAISESTIVRPKLFTCEVLLTNFYDFLMSVNLVNLKNEVKDYINLFEMLHYESYICTIYLNAQVLENMCLVGFSPVENYKTQGNYMILSLTFKEIMFFDVNMASEIGNFQATSEDISPSISSLYNF